MDIIWSHFSGLNIQLEADLKQLIQIIKIKKLLFNNKQLYNSFVYVRNCIILCLFIGCYGVLYKHVTHHT